MELSFNKTRQNPHDEKPSEQSRFKRLAAAVAATFCFSPIAENIAHAEDAEPTDDAPRQIQLDEDFELSAEAEEETIDVEETPQEEPQVQQDERVFYHNLGVEPHSQSRSEFEDPGLSLYPNTVDIGGRRRGISLNNLWDLGGNILGNEAGTGVFGSVRYTDLFRFDAGNIWFGEQAAPFARFFIRPELNLWRFKLAYYGSVAGLANMPSYLYTSHSAGVGFSYPIRLDSSDENRTLRIRIGAVGGGAISYPAWDDIYFNLTTGLSLQLTGYPSSNYDFLLYGMTTFYAAASNPMETAYIGYYDLQFQSVEAGLQVRFFDYTLRGFADIGRLNNRYGLRGTWTVDFSDTVEADLWLALGITHWSEELGGRIDPLAMVGATVVFGGSSINSTNTSRYEHLQNGGIRFAETDFPSDEDMGPYGFGRSGNPVVDERINEAKQRIMSSHNFEEFTRSYNGASEEDVILTARFLGASLQQVAYANNAADALNNTQFFDSEVVRIASATNETIFAYMQEYIDWYENHDPTEQMPEHLQNGIAVCAGIHWLVAEFLRGNEIDTIVASVNTPNGPHVVAISQMTDRTMLFDYGNLYVTDPDRLDEVIRFYGQNRQAPTFQSQFFGPDGYMGTYITSEGRLLHQTVGIENGEILQREFLGVR
ncbi:hypothetical protein KKB44_06500 [Candidatus Micrarchaeota archaeon]|nr:hypothetical protein [Candidatus Micrarchaeota archaeon]